MQQLDGPTLEPASGADATGLVIFLHGYGADGNDLIDIGRLWSRELPDLAFVSPHAPFPCGMAPMGREWFPLPRLSPDEYSKGVYLAAPHLQAFIDQQQQHRNLAGNAVALVGFSQGTMMALHVGLRQQEKLAGIIGFSGALAAPDRLSEEIKSRPEIALFHGESDQVVPVSATHQAVDELSRANVSVTKTISPGLGHGIDQTGLVDGAAWLKRWFSRA